MPSFEKELWIRVDKMARDCHNLKMVSRISDVEKALRQHLKLPYSPYLNRVREVNKIILHNYEKSIVKKFPCGLHGCENKFFIQLIPGQILYPKYCGEHRTEHRRRQFSILASPTS